MYQIVLSDGAKVGMTEKPTYIRKARNGCFVLCDKESDAQGVAFEGTPYQLQGRDEMGGTAGSVSLFHVDAGTQIFQTQNGVLESQLAIAELAEAIMNDAEV